MFLVSVIACLLFTGCNDSKKPNVANFTNAINQYLARHGQACTFFAQTFPINVPASELKDHYGTAPQMAALEEAGVVRGTDTTAVIRGMVGALGPSALRPVRHYELTDVGKKYFQAKPSVLGRSSAFCYGQKTVDSIVSWTKPEPMGSSTQSEVTYTYRIAGLATWAQRADVQQAFGDIRTTVGGISKADETAEVELTDKGWEVPEQ